MILAGLTTLLAQRSPVMHLGDRFRPGQAGGPLGTSLLPWLVVTVGLGLTWLVVTWLNRRRQRRRHAPRKLFRDLCKAHQLTRRQRRMLWRLAQRRQLPQPALLFLDPQSWGLEQAESLGAEAQRELTALQRRLFASQ